MIEYEVQQFKFDCDFEVKAGDTVELWVVLGEDNLLHVTGGQTLTNSISPQGLPDIGVNVIEKVSMKERLS